MEYITELPEWDGKKILIIRLDRLGDLIVSTPTIEVIRKAFPNSQIDLLGSSLNCALFKYCSHIDNTYTYTKNLFNFLNLIKLLRAQKYDVIINLVPHSRSANFFVRCICAPIKLAVCTPPKERYNKLFTHAGLASDKFHILEFYQDNMKRMGFETPSLVPIINVPQNIKDYVLLNFPKDLNRMRIIISIGNIKRPHKRWNIKKYGEVIEFLCKKYNKTEKKLDIYVMVGKSDLILIDELNAVSKEYYTLYIGKDIAESVALIDSSDLFICTSSGPSHIAASTSCPILSLLNPYMYGGWRPLRENDRCIINDNIYDIAIEEVINEVEKYIQQYDKKTKNIKE